MPCNRWSLGEPDGTNFHEIVVLPTLAPQLAHHQNLGPYLVPLEGPEQPQPFPDATTVPPQAPDTNMRAEQLAGNVSPSRTFFLSATMFFMGPSEGPHARPKKLSETKNGPALEIYIMTRCDLLQHVLQLHDLHLHYQPSDISGFPVKISWSGSPGGKSNAPTVRDDTEFKNVIDQLRGAKKSIVSILVSFDMEQMEPYRSRVGSVIDPRLPGWSAGEMRFGTHVPRPDMYAADAQLHGNIMIDIKEEWKCDQHDGACYRKDNKHFRLNRWKLKAWAAAVAAKTTTPRDPLADLFQDNDVCMSAPVKARGRSGPRSASDSGESDAMRLISAVIPLITSLSHTPLQRQNTLPNLPELPSTPRRLKRTYSFYGAPPQHSSQPSPSPLSQPGPPSSPPPSVEHELRLCIDTFGRAKSLDETTVDSVFTGLHSKEYSPDTLEVIRVERVAELTHLVEGQAAGLVKFAREWSRKVQQKRAKLTHN